MGFNDQQRNINALIATNGNVSAAIQYLLNNQDNDTNNNSKKKE